MKLKQTETIKSNSYKCTCRPVLKYVFGNVCGRVIRGESEVFCFPTDQNEAKEHLKVQTRIIPYST